MIREQQTNRRAEALRRIASGESLRTVARDAGLSAQYLRVLANQVGILIPRKRYALRPNILRERITEDLKSISNYAEIARRQGVSREYVRQVAGKEDHYGHGTDSRAGRTL